jgi:hypothetical protein
MAERCEWMVNTGPSVGNVGPLTRKVLDYEQTMKRLAPAVKASGDWTPLADLVAVDEFERVGTVLEVQNWRQYTQMLTQWSSATLRFETTLRRVCELPGLVYFEIEERHYRRDSVAVVNSLTVFEFNEAGKIRRLSVYLQQ